jgi:hypothetical protein
VTIVFGDAGVDAEAVDVVDAEVAGNACPGFVVFVAWVGAAGTAALDGGLDWVAAMVGELTGLRYRKK